MKRLGFVVVLAGMVIASLVWAQTNTVLSRNAVGYEKITVPSNGLQLVRLDFVPVDASPGSGSISVSNLIGNQLPNLSQVWVWDVTNANYVSSGRSRTGVWVPDLMIPRGAGMWLKSAGTSNVDVYLMGEVPGEYATGTSTTNFITSGVTLSGYPYPAAIKFTNTDLYKNSTNLEQLWVWNASVQNYESYGKNRTGVWTPTTITNLELSPGQGFWYVSKRATTYGWVEPKPYTWP
jgi:hypothetical protein